jgi:hypothetical protein
MANRVLYRERCTGVMEREWQLLFLGWRVGIFAEDLAAYLVGSRHLSVLLTAS